ncbi:MAG: LamG domain-containing protein [Alphaproteobacteria bacterium]|nr:LamG domain-containing protein [Alphaproteobacteria bacterium]
MNKKQHLAFTAIELSIVLVVIALLMAIVGQGVRMISSGTITNARSLTARSSVPNIDGLVAWYETTSLDSLKQTEAIDGKQISTWYDISPDSIPGKKNTLTRTPSSAVTYKLKGINNVPSVYFDGSGKLAVTDFYQGSSAQSTLFIVFNPTAVPSGSANILIDSGHTDADGSNVYAIGLVSSSRMQFHLGNGLAGAIPSTSPASLVVGQNYVLATNLNSSYSKAYLNDASTAINSNAAFNPGSHLLQGITVGTDRNGAFTYNGLVSEVIIYNRILSNKERRDVMNYLSKKYAIKVVGL